MSLNLKAKEKISLELKGYIPSLCAKELLPEGLDPLVVNDMTPVCLHIAKIERMNWRHLSFFNMSYDKAMWHMAVTNEEQHGWFLITCDLNHTFIRNLSNIFFNYPVRNSEFTFLEKRKSLITRHQSEMGEEMCCHVEIGADSAQKALISPFFIEHRNKIYQIDIEETYPDFCRLAKVDIVKDNISREIFGNSVQWEEECYVFRGRAITWKGTPI